MTRQDFELIAAVINNWQPNDPMPDWVVAIVREGMARDMAGALAATNPRFDPARFVATATESNRR